ncbi:MAG: phage portal protein [Rickettsiales bacterium]|jgi:HK97 family phage portal protein|nr:phage portal protein [Rickettsiales bacterium]
MKLFTKKPQRQEIKTYYHPLGRPIWNEKNYEIFAKEGYAKNAIVYKCINLIAKNAANVPFLLYDKNKNKSIENHPLMQLLKKPNPSQNGVDFFESLYSYKLIAGNVYIQNIKQKELYLLRPDRVNIVANNTLPIAYKYKVGNNEKTFYADEILHIKTFNPLNDYYGLSVVEASSNAIDQYNEGSNWNKAMLQNGAKPSGALIVKGDKETSSFLTNEQFDRLKKQLNDDFSGSNNAGRPLLLEGGLEWQEMSLKPTDMDFLNTKYSCARDIALTFGVPPQLLGIQGDSTYNNMGEARLSLWEETILPLLDNTIEAFNNYFCNSDIGFYYEKDKISALNSQQEKYWNKIAIADFLSSDEKKKLLDLQ